MHHAAHRNGGGGGVLGPQRFEAVARTGGGGRSSLARMTSRQSEVDGPRPVSGGGGATCALVAAAPTAVTGSGLHQHHVRLVARRGRPSRAGGAFAYDVGKHFGFFDPGPVRFLWFGFV